MLLDALFIVWTSAVLQFANLILTSYLLTAPRRDLLVSQLVSAAFQGLLIGFSSYSLYIGSVSEIIPCLLFGYLLYDLINMLTKPFGKPAYEIYVHHVAVLTIMVLIKTCTRYTIDLLVQLIIILESSSWMLNITNIGKQYVPPGYSRALALANLVVYGGTRCILFPIWIYTYSLEDEFTILKGLLVSIFVLGNIAFGVWFYKLLLKYLTKYQ